LGSIYVESPPWWINPGFHLFVDYGSHDLVDDRSQISAQPPAKKTTGLIEKETEVSYDLYGIRLRAKAVCMRFNLILFVLVLVLVLEIRIL
jgi:hypothetical protein